jgi:hypothetical protein
MTYTEYPTASPFLTISGLVPSGPPPVGNVVVSKAVRELIGTEGYNRKTMVVSSPAGY